MMPNEITEEYVKSMVRLYSTKEYNEFTEEELDKLEKIMCDGLESEDGE